jgi:hypothetical protein
MARQRGGGWTALCFGLCLILLPLCGGSGVAMLPPLVAWLFGYVAWGWWSGREPGGMARSIGAISLMVSSAVVALYFNGYARPPYHPPSPSIAALTITTLECLSLAVFPGASSFWLPTGLFVASLIVGTLWLVVTAGLREPEERLRASGLIAVILSLLSVATAVGLSRSGLGPSSGLYSRYVTLTAPLIGVLYLAWLVYGLTLTRWLVHGCLLAILCMTLPANTKYGLKFGGRSRVSQLRVERALRGGISIPGLADKSLHGIYPDATYVRENLDMLRTARMGPFKNFKGHLAVAREAPAVIR